MCVHEFVLDSLSSLKQTEFCSAQGTCFLFLWLISLFIWNIDVNHNVKFITNCDSLSCSVKCVFTGNDIDDDLQPITGQSKSTYLKSSPQPFFPPYSCFCCCFSLQISVRTTWSVSCFFSFGVIPVLNQNSTHAWSYVIPCITSRSVNETELSGFFVVK